MFRQPNVHDVQRTGGVNGRAEFAQRIRRALANVEAGELLGHRINLGNPLLKVSRCTNH